MYEYIIVKPKEIIAEIITYFSVLLVRIKNKEFINNFR